MAERDQVLQSEQLTRRHRQGHHHGKATEDGAGNKVRREDGGVPARKLTGGKVKGHHAVNRKHQRSGERCQQQVRALITVPMAIGAAPSEREQTVRHLLNLALGTIAHGGQVRHQADVPEEQRNREVGTHCTHVPQERTAELRPHVHLVWDWEEPVRQPHATNVNAGEESGADHREDGHRLCKSVDAGAPLLSEQEQDGADQRSCVTDTNPEHEVGDVKGPHHRVVETPDADAGEDQIVDDESKVHHQQHADAKHDVPRHWRLARLIGAADRVGDLMEIGVPKDQRGALAWDIPGVINVVGWNGAHALPP